MISKKTLPLLSWILYDLASSAYFVIIQTFLFASYFTSRVASDKTTGVTLWGLTLSLAGLLIALLGPLLGTLADKVGSRKGWLATFTILVATAVFFMWWVKPDPTYTFLALVLLLISTCSAEFAFIFYNAELSDLTEQKSIGKWSGWGWALGYIGGVISLLCCLFLFINEPPLIPALDPSQAQDIRATFLFVFFWYLIFSFPLLYLLPKESKKPSKTILKDSFSDLKHLLQSNPRTLFQFLLARMIYTDALISLFAFGGVYAATTFHLSEQQLLLYAITLNLSAGLGAFAFSFLDDTIGSKNMISIALAGLIVTGSTALTMHTYTHFWLATLLMSLFIGPAQSSSRAYLAKKAPHHSRRQYFGLFALSGKATAFLGPLSISLITYTTGSLRLGMSSIIVFLIVGFLLMPKSERGSN